MHGPPLDIRGAILSASDRVELSITLIKGIEAQSVAEIGVWRGEYAEIILRHCPAIERYYMIDPWIKLPSWNKPFNVDDSFFDEVFREAMNRTAAFAEKIVLCRGTAMSTLEKIDHPLDLVYIDGDHTLRGILIDLMTIYPLIQPGGLVVGDDCVPSIFQHGFGYEPTLVYPMVVYFAEAVKAKIFLSRLNQFVIRKPTPEEESEFSIDDVHGAFPYPDLRSQFSLRKLAEAAARTWVRPLLSDAMVAKIKTALAVGRSRKA